jgi:DNA-binding XRE family transcriptional regulator
MESANGTMVKGVTAKMPSKKQRDPRAEALRALGDRVRTIRKEKGLTQEALAEALELSVAYVSLIERGGRNPPYTTVVAIARALGTNMAEICGDEA